MNIKFLITLFILAVCTRAVQSSNRKTQRNSIYSIKSVVGRLCSDITTMKEKMTGMEMENDELQEKVKDLNDLQTKVSDLEVKNDDLKIKCSALEMKVSDMEIENDGQQMKIDDLEMKVSDLEIENNEQKMKIDDLEQIINQPDPAVAFSAYVDENTSPSGANDTFVFNKVLTNEGEAYDESNGVFTCPISGIYVFTVVASSRGQNTWATLKINDNTILEAFGEAPGDYDDDQGTNTAVVQCNKGDTVWINGVKGQLRGDSDGQSNSRTSSFSGFLLRQTND